MKNPILLLLFIFTLQSCVEKIGKAINENHPISEEQIQTPVFPTEYTSSLRENEKLELGKIYTDTVTYFEFNENGDYWWFYVRKGKDTIGLVYNDISNFVNGEELEIRWKIDSIWIAGEGERLDFSEWLIAVKKLKPLKLTDKKVNFLWREKRYLEDSPTIPDGATVQNTFDKIDLEITGNITTVFFNASGINV